MDLVTENFKQIITDLTNNRSNYTHAEQLTILAKLYKQFVLEKTILDLLKIHTRKVTYVRSIDKLILVDIVKVLYSNKEVNFNIYKDIVTNSEKPHTLLKITMPATDKVYTTASEFSALVRSLGIDNVIDLFNMLVYMRYDNI